MEKFDLKPGNVKLLISNLDSLKKKIENILKLKDKYNDLRFIIDTISKFSTWLDKFKVETLEKTDDDYKDREKYINLIKNQFEAFFNNEDKEMQKLVNELKDTLDIINLKFEPQENLNEKRERGNISQNLLEDEYNPFDISSKDEKINNLQNNFSYLNGNIDKQNTSDDSVNNNQEINKINKIELIDYKKRFRNNFDHVIKLLIYKCRILENSNNISELPLISDKNSIDQIIEYLLKFIELSSGTTIEDYNKDEGTEILNKTLRDYIDDIGSSKSLSENNDKRNLDQIEDEFEDEVYITNEVLHYDNFGFKKIKEKLFYFINIISKENKILNNENLEKISKEISDDLDINDDDLFIIQNSRVDNFVKTFNFNKISFKQLEKIPSFSKIYELKSLDMVLLRKELQIKKEYLDYRGNFINPNSRNNIFRGKEIYDPPYGWMGLGLNVLDKYENNNWLEDISNKSEWAIAYRGITSKNPDKIKNYLKHFIITRNLEIAETTSEKSIINKKVWNLKSGIYMTPYIKTAEKFTKTISFNKKNYKILLMAKVKISEIIEEEDSNFWILKNDAIRIYRVLFKEI